MNVLRQLIRKYVKTENKEQVESLFEAIKKFKYVNVTNAEHILVHLPKEMLPEEMPKEKNKKKPKKRKKKSNSKLRYAYVFESNVEFLDEGGYGKVFEMERNDKTFAVKTFRKQGSFQHEKEVLNLLKNNACPNIVTGDAFHYKNKNNGVIIMPYYLTWENCIIDKPYKIAKQVHWQINCLREKNIIYTDLKPENILFDDDGNVILGDLGSIPISENVMSTYTKNMNSVEAIQCAEFVIFVYILYYTFAANLDQNKTDQNKAVKTLLNDLANEFDVVVVFEKTQKKDIKFGKKKIEDIGVNENSEKYRNLSYKNMMEKIETILSQAKQEKIPDKTEFVTKQPTWLHSLRL